MKTTLLLLSLLVMTSLTSQHFYVISVTGEIYAGQKALQPKDRLTEETQLRFVGEEAEAYLMSPSKGYFALSPRNIYPKGKREFLAAVKNALLPPSELKSTAIRTAGYDTTHQVILEDYFDLLDYFRGPILYLDSLNLFLAEDGFFKDNTQLEWTIIYGTDTIVQTLAVAQQHITLILPADLLQNAHHLKHEVRYLPAYEEEDITPYSFQLLPLDASSLLPELLTLREIVDPNEEEDFLVQYAVPYVEQRYGKIHPVQLQKLLEE